jgi:hypothetical protein
MPIQYREEGARAALAKHLQDLVELAADGKTPAKDQTQCNTAKAAALAELNALPTEFTGAVVIIEAQAHAGGRQLNVQVVPKKLRL